MGPFITIDSREVRFSKANPWRTQHLAMAAIPHDHTKEGRKNFIENLIECHPGIWKSLIPAIGNQYLPYESLDANKVDEAVSELIDEGRVEQVDRPKNMKCVGSRGRIRHLKTTKAASYSCNLIRFKNLTNGSVRASKHDAEYHQKKFDEIFDKAEGTTGSEKLSNALRDYNTVIKRCEGYE